MLNTNGTSTDGGKGRAPAYSPFATFKNFTGGLKEKGVPPRIDKSLMATMSGSSQSVLSASLRALQLVDESDATQPLYRELIGAHGTEAWPAVLGRVIDSAYAETLEDFDLKSATAAMLDERFKDFGASIREKATRFLLTALEDAGREVSPHLKVGVAKTKRVPSTPRKKPRAARTAPYVPPAPEASPPPEATKVHTFPLRKDFEARLWLPQDLSKADVDRLHQFLSIIPFEE